MNILIQASSLVGHELEYLHHFYDYATRDKQNQYVFLIPYNFDSYKERYVWPKATNIIIEYIHEDILSNISSLSGVFGEIKMKYYRCKILMQYCKKYKISRIVSSTFIGYFPLSVLFLSSEIDLRGIIYKSPYKRKFSIFQKIKNSLFFYMISKCDIYKKVFILNDEMGANWLNNKYLTNKFSFLPDPIPQISSDYSDIRNQFDIPKNNIVFLQFGGLGYRKRTIDILKAINMIPDASGFTFIFAGKLNSCREEFRNYIVNMNNNVQIISIDRFCEDKLLHSLCYSCNYILVPYINCDSSSGCLGHAAYFNKPVIGPSDGLLGRLIKDNKLGYNLPKDASLEDLKYIILNYNIIKPIDGSKYVDKNRIENFQKNIFM